MLFRQSAVRLLWEHARLSRGMLWQFLLVYEGQKELYMYVD